MSVQVFQRVGERDLPLAANKLTPKEREKITDFAEDLERRGMHGAVVLVSIAEFPSVLESEGIVGSRAADARTVGFFIMPRQIPDDPQRYEQMFLRTLAASPSLPRM